VPNVISVNQQIGQLNTTASTYPQRFCCGTYGGEPEAEPGSPGKRLFNGSHSSGNWLVLQQLTAILTSASELSNVC